MLSNKLTIIPAQISDRWEELSRTFIQDNSRERDLKIMQIEKKKDKGF